MVWGDGQSGTIGEPLGDSLVVRVVDRFGDPVGGSEVTWTAEVGGSVTPPTSVTSPDGQAGTQRVLGAEVGTYLTTAAILGIEDAPEPAVFTTIGVAARLAFTVAPPATAASGVPLSPQPVLQLQDAGGSDIAREGGGHRADLRRGGSMVGDEPTSDVGGRVAFADLAIRGSPGTQAHLRRRWLRLGDRQRVTRRRGAGVDRGDGGERAGGGGGHGGGDPAGGGGARRGRQPPRGIPVTFKVTGAAGRWTVPIR